MPEEIRRRRKADVPPFRDVRNTSNNERWYMCLCPVCKMSSASESEVVSRRGKKWQSFSPGGMCGLNLAVCGTNTAISNKSIFTWKPTFVNETNAFYQHVDRALGICWWGSHKGSHAKLQYFSKQPLGFLTPCRHLNFFPPLLNLHPNALPLFSLIYNADTGALSVKEVHAQDGAGWETIFFFHIPRVNCADKIFILYKKPFSICKCIIKEYTRRHKIIISTAAQR